MVRASAQFSQPLICPTYLFSWFVDVLNELCLGGVQRIWLDHKRKFGISAHRTPHLWANFARLVQPCTPTRWPMLRAPPEQTTCLFYFEWLEMLPGGTTIAGLCVRSLIPERAKALTKKSFEF